MFVIRTVRVFIHLEAALSKMADRGRDKPGDNFMKNIIEHGKSK